MEASPVKRVRQNVKAAVLRSLREPRRDPPVYLYTSGRAIQTDPRESTRHIDADCISRAHGWVELRESE